MNTTVASIDGKKSAITTAKDALCTCRKAEVIANFDSEGCQLELDCWKKDVDKKKAAESSFLRDKNKEPVTQYTDSNGADMCADLLISSSSEDTAALALFASSLTESNNHWDERKSSLEVLVLAHQKAKDAKEDLNNGTGAYKDRGGCAALLITKNKKNSDYTTAQSKATTLQCTYYTT